MTEGLGYEPLRTLCCMECLFIHMRIFNLTHFASQSLPSEIRRATIIIIFTAYHITHCIIALAL